MPRRYIRGRRAAITALTLGLTITAGGGAAGAAPQGEERTSGRVTRTAGGDDAPALTPGQVRSQLAEAAALQKTLTDTNAQVALASRRLAQLAATSSAAMSAVAAAKSEEAKAAALEKAQLRLLRVLSSQALAAKRDVNGMAYDAYVNGSGELRDVAALVKAASGGGRDAAIVGFLADARAADGRRFTSLATAQQATARAAVAARLTRQAATRRAVAAQRNVDAALVAQRRALLDLREKASATSTTLSGLGVSTGRAGRGVDLAAVSAATTKPLCTQDTGTYANGRIPASALCPITGAPGHMMRPAAARALNALKAAYASDFGADLCITDTYRSLSAQIDVRARKPTLAAVPGTSNHGLGLATDLCGGVESFGTPQHLWMQQHAPLFGFYHPQWAEPHGSKPEPWHWEFAT